MSDPDREAELEILADWNGVFMPLKDVTVPALDRGFLFGDGVYEVIRVYGASPFRLQDHLDRLATSLASVQMKHVEIAQVKTRLLALIEESSLEDALIYCQITRGVAPRTHHYPDHYQPNILMYIQPFTDVYAETRRTGARAITHRDIRWRRNDIKATSLIANCMAASFARENNCLEVVFIDDRGYMTEGSHTSIFGIKDGNILVAPSSANVLPGITKRQVLEIADNTGIALVETRVKEEDIYGLDELFIAGTPEEIISIVEVNDRKIGTGEPGPLVKRIHNEFKNILAAVVSKN